MKSKLQKSKKKFKEELSLNKIVSFLIANQIKKRLIDKKDMILDKINSAIGWFH